MNTIQNYQLRRHDQRGMVSFTVTLVMILVISLIVIGFAQISRRNQREMLDRQLSTQAFYAAESGVNAAAAVVRKNPETVVSKTDCNTTQGSSVYTQASPVLNDNPNVRYTCLLVDPLVPDLKTAAHTSKLSIMRINATNDNGSAPSNLSQLSIQWSNADGAVADPVGCAANVGENAKNPGLCGYGLMRVDILAIKNDGSTNTSSAQALLDNTQTVYVQPLRSGGGTANLTAATKAMTTGAQCVTADKKCTIRLNLSNDYRNKSFYVRLTSMYRDAPSVTIDGTMTDGSSAFFKGQQVQIDVTGKAQDILRRVQVRMPVETAWDKTNPVFGLWSSTSICKRFTIVPNTNNYTTECAN